MKKLWMMIAALLVALPLVAQDVEIRDDHPGEYVVREGDTLWDIAGRFLTEPWQWPAIWQANPQIDNPHLIYPGDVISLIYVDGQPRLVLNADRRLSPEIRRTPMTGPVTTVPLDAIEPYLIKPRFASLQDLEGMPYVVANQDQRYVAAAPRQVFVRGLSGFREGDEVVVARLNAQFESVDRDGRGDVRQNRMRPNRGAVPSDQRPVNLGQRRLDFFRARGDILGYQLWEVARAEVLNAGDPATLGLVESEMEVRAGDYILPVDPYIYDLTFYPQAPDFAIPDNASVIGIEGDGVAVGHYQVVALDVGAAEGVEPGHTFSVFHPGEFVEDDFARGLKGRPAPSFVDDRRVELPRQYIGQVMVFRAFDDVSYALVMAGERGVRRGDVLDLPDKRF